MPKRAESMPTAGMTSHAPPSRATNDGTLRFAQRFAAVLGDDFYRATTSGVTVSSIGFGTYLGDSIDADDAAYEASLQHAVASGVNVIDTAINYRSQRSERAVGVAIQRLTSAGVAARDELVVSSKGGYLPLDRTPPPTRAAYQEYVQREFIDRQILRPDELVGGGHSMAPRFLRFCLAKSRQNLGLRTIDIYYLHNPGQAAAGISADELAVQLRAAFGFFEEAVARGDIGVYGCATWDELRVTPDSRGHLSLERLVRIAQEVAGDAHHFKVIQLPINLAMTEAVRVPTQVVGGRMTTVLDAAMDLGLTVVASASLMQGRLTGGLPPALADHFPAASTDAQRALEFVRTVPGVTCALAGMKTLAHVDENLGGVWRR